MVTIPYFQCFFLHYLLEKTAWLYKPLFGSRCMVNIRVSIAMQLFVLPALIDLWS